MLNYVKSRTTGENQITIMARLKPGEDKEKMKMAIRRFIRKLRKKANGQIGFEYVITSEERHSL